MLRTPSAHRLVGGSEDRRESVWKILMMCQMQSHRVQEVRHVGHVKRRREQLRHR